MYQFPAVTEDIRQGDLFVKLPKARVSMEDVSVIDEMNNVKAAWWESIASQGESYDLILPVTVVSGIVISQDCDAARTEEITFAEVVEFDKLESIGHLSAPKFIEKLPRHTRLSQRWFYLPPDERLGFSERMCADMRSIIQVPREQLEHRRQLRIGRLVRVAYEHFRERVSEYYRRYPYNEWYPFTAPEYEEYAKKHDDACSYPWQVSS